MVCTGVCVGVCVCVCVVCVYAQYLRKNDKRQCFECRGGPNICIERSTLFTADNGGGQAADNAPLRGNKGGYFEGGVRVVGFVASPRLRTSGAQHVGLVHVSDWFPTLVGLAGGDVTTLDVDGVDVWDSIR